ncbi:hypothetical protein AC1031_008831 [Aphanomyces cochlioides]|nr:hypothetical protein AC1031_008831 [Aphanomyces cochlioides]
MPSSDAGSNEALSEDALLDASNLTSTTYMDKLYTMLEQCPKSIASWTPNGTAFVVYDTAELEATILPQFFKPIKFESFARHLSSYGFRKIKAVVNNTELFAFRHTSFVRGQSDQVHAIQRRRRHRHTQGTTTNGGDTAHPAPTGLTAVGLQDLRDAINQLRSDMAETKAMVHTLMSLDSLDGTPNPPASS